MASEIKWVKLYIEMFSNAKIKKLRRLPSGNDIVLLWIMLLAKAGECNSGGMIFITPKIPYTQDDLADEFGFKEATVARALDVFMEFGMIEVREDGFLLIKNWVEYQNIDGMDKVREQTRRRVAEHRGKKAGESGNVTYEENAAPCNVTCNGDVTQCNVTCNADVTQCNATRNVTVTRCNATEEEEEEREKEIHSLTLSRAGEKNRSEETGAVENSAVGVTEEQKQRLLGGELGGGVIMLSGEQFDSLCELLSFDELNKYIAIVRDCELSGRKFKRKTHYQAILDMARKDRAVAARGEGGL